MAHAGVQGCTQSSQAYACMIGIHTTQAPCDMCWSCGLHAALAKADRALSCCCYGFKQWPDIATAVALCNCTCGLTCHPVMMPSASKRPPQPEMVPRMMGAATTPGYNCTARLTCGIPAQHIPSEQHLSSNHGQQVMRKRPSTGYSSYD
mgnify:CR=1 FL=1